MFQAIGLDFGTTNTVIAKTKGAGRAEAVTFAFHDEALATFRSVLCFFLDEVGRLSTHQVEAGPWAIQHFIDEPDDCRFLQSLKSFVASREFQHTLVYGRRYQLESLLTVFLRQLWRRAGWSASDLPARIVLGRPVEFAGGNPDAGLALQRYQAALAPFGFADIRYVYEPVAAAFFYAQRLTRDATILVADFGGGTTDYSVIRFELADGGIRAQPLSHAGVGVAGDQFDFHIINNVIAPRLGKGSRYTSMGKVLELPRGVYANFARWNQLSVMKHAREFQEIKRLLRWSEQPELLERFIELVEHDHGYPLYKAVSEAKERLSRAERTELSFAASSFAIEVTIERHDFEAWIAPDLSRMAAALDTALERAALGPHEIDKVFLTGGTSFVPAVRRLFERRFGAAKIESGDELLSIAHGLALIGATDEIDQWTAGPEGMPLSQDDPDPS